MCGIVSPDPLPRFALMIGHIPVGRSDLALAEERRTERKSSLRGIEGVLRATRCRGTEAPAPAHVGGDVVRLRRRRLAPWLLDEPLPLGVALEKEVDSVAEARAFGSENAVHDRIRSDCEAVP